MKDYGFAAWVYLGSQIKTARKQAGLRDSKLWADKVGRSTRVLLGLERGERVGDDTLERIEEALGWPLGRCETILASRPSRPDLEQFDPAAQRNLSVVPGRVETPDDDEDDNEVLAAIRRDPTLSDEAKAHFLNQYGLLRELSRHQSGLLQHVAEGERKGPPDPKLEAEIDADVRKAARDNPKSPFSDK